MGEEVGGPLLSWRADDKRVMVEEHSVLGVGAGAGRGRTGRPVGRWLGRQG